MTATTAPRIYGTAPRSLELACAVRDTELATVGFSATPVADPGAYADYDHLVSANVLRYRGTAPTPTTLPTVLPTDPALQARVDTLTQRRSVSTEFGDRAAITMGAALWVDLVAGAAAFDGFVPGLTWVLPSAVALGAAGAVLRHLGSRDAWRLATRRLQEAQAADVPQPVADAYQRILAASTEMQDSTDDTGGATHSADAIASARLAGEGARDIVALIHNHQSAGTLHTPPAQALVEELYRLAAEVDAYLTLHNAQRFAPGEDEALTTIAGTSALTFRPVSELA